MTKEPVQQLKCQRLHGEEIEGADDLPVVLEKRQPRFALGRPGVACDADTGRLSAQRQRTRASTARRGSPELPNPGFLALSVGSERESPR
jgi:hypothetical protein